MRKDQTMKRKRHTEEQIIAILKEHEAGVKTADLCRKHGISEASFYNWKAKYGGLGSQALVGPSSTYHGDGNSLMPASAGTISARMIRIQRMMAVCDGIVLISPVK